VLAGSAGAIRNEKKKAKVFKKLQKTLASLKFVPHLLREHVCHVGGVKKKRTRSSEHIECDVLEILKTKNEIIELKDLNKPLDLQSK
jgi:hypothetical protein